MWSQWQTGQRVRYVKNSVRNNFPEVAAEVVEHEMLPDGKPSHAVTIRLLSEDRDVVVHAAALYEDFNV